MTNSKHVVFIGAENGALIGGKTGGVGDVLNYLPYALAELGWRCTVIIPSYGTLHQKNPSKFIGKVAFPFRGQPHEADLWQLEAKQSHPLVEHIVIEHSWIRGEPIYFNDPSNQAFDRDASKYALFCSAVGQLLKLDVFNDAVIHLHDWHTATLFVLKNLHSAFVHLHRFKFIFTIHNLGIQGNRPMRGEHSSLEGWLPELFVNTDWVHFWKDHRHDFWMYTPMAIGIRFANIVNTVSPSYANEILTPSAPQDGYYGGEGLEILLRHAKMQNRLFGILNGCDYPQKTHPRLSSLELFDLIIDEMKERKVYLSGLSWENGIHRLMWLKQLRIGMKLTTVTRVVGQKVGMICDRLQNGQFVLDPIIAKLNEVNGVYIILGTGTPEFVHSLSEACHYHERFLYIHGFSEKIAQAVYSSGDLFLMPSLYEPCGISQMIAMREAQPCVVHEVGGLKDTVWNDVNGFSFGGWTMNDKVENFVKTVQWAINMYHGDRPRWERIQSAAKNARFEWSASAQKYIELYSA